MAGKIFISYRRGDEPGFTQALLGRLEQAFPSEQLFIDVDNIPPGEDFVKMLASQVAQCDAMLTVIGNGWLDARDERGNRRLDDPGDFVRIEIESALDQGKRVIPVLVHQASMPHANDLPETLRPLATRNAVRLTHERFRSDSQGLIKALQQSLDDIQAQRRQAEAAAKEKRSVKIGPRRGWQLPAVAAPSAVALVAIVIAAVYWFELRVPSQPTAAPTVTPTVPADAPAAALPSDIPANVPPPMPRADERSWELLKETTDQAALAHFIAQYPESPLRKEAEARIAALDAAQAPKPAPLPPDQVAWAIVKDTRDPDQLRRFIDQFPDSSARSDADQRIAALAAEAAKAAADAASNAQKLTRALQLELIRVGCLTGDANGQFDDATRAAWRSFVKLTSLKLQDEVSADALKAIRGIDKRVCPLQCAAGQHAEGDRCVANPPPASKREETAPSRPPARQSSHPAARGGRCFSFQGRQFCE